MGGHSVFGNPATQVPENPKAEHPTQVVMLTREISAGPNRFWLRCLEPKKSRSLSSKTLFALPGSSQPVS